MDLVGLREKNKRIVLDLKIKDEKVVEDLNTQSIKQATKDSVRAIMLQELIEFEDI